MKLFDNIFIPFIAALALTVVGCNESKNSTKNSTENKAALSRETSAKVETPAVEGTKTIALANGASVTWIQDNEGKKFMPRELCGVGSF